MENEVKNTILVAGGTGDLGGRIVKSLIEKGADVRVLVRNGTSLEKTEKLKQLGAAVFPADMNNLADLEKACQGISCVVSALQGLHDVIVDMQSLLLEAAINAGVPRFIPSDFSTDYTQLSPGDNRNFDLRREFFERIDQSKIAATTIFNGGFAELLNYNLPFLDFKNKSVGYFEDPEWRVDFTTKDNTAEFTAATALDSETPRILRIASFQINATEMQSVAKEITKEDFKLIRLSSRAELAEKNKHDRAANPDGEKEVYPRWQQAQYLYGMFSSQNRTLDNDRYPEINWTSIQELLSNRR